MSVKLRRGLSRMPGLDPEHQPWRCAKCNVPVRKGMNDPCDCTRAIAAASVDKKESAQ